MACAQACGTGRRARTRPGRAARTVTPESCWQPTQWQPCGQGPPRSYSHCTDEAGNFKPVSRRPAQARTSPVPAAAPGPGLGLANPPGAEPGIARHQQNALKLTSLRIMIMMFFCFQVFKIMKIIMKKDSEIKVFSTFTNYFHFFYHYLYYGSQSLQ